MFNSVIVRSSCITSTSSHGQSSCCLRAEPESDVKSSFLSFKVQREGDLQEAGPDLQSVLRLPLHPALLAPCSDLYCVTCTTGSHLLVSISVFLLRE